MGTIEHTIPSHFYLPRSKIVNPFTSKPLLRDCPRAREAEWEAFRGVLLLRDVGLVMSCELVTPNSPDDTLGKDIARVILRCKRHWFALNIGISNRALRRHRNLERFHWEMVFGKIEEPEPITLFKHNPRSEGYQGVRDRLFEPISKHLQICSGSS